ncbi:MULTISPECIES: hypothetical protein [Achromobacter]|uniref:hypothetical protein n=1 Tax=Achromobacter TaxID=222 RepID=UPI001C46A298|nr:MULTISPECIES: hypothetical protein [Achromobacter]MBV7500847.1 hypothetical protein [Achromobacter sp. ACM05]MCG7329188.1 hypothetical protein [Achromobacter sp. ACRQX]
MFDKLKALREGAAVKAKALTSRTAGALESSKAQLGEAAASARAKSLELAGATAERGRELAGATAEKGRELAGATAEKGSALVEQHWQTIERVTVDGLLSVSAEKLKDDAMVKDVLERAYEALPTVIRLVLPRERYLEIVIQKKQPLLAKIEGARNRRQERAQSGAANKDRDG